MNIIILCEGSCGLRHNLLYIIPFRIPYILLLHELNVIIQLKEIYYM